MNTNQRKRIKTEFVNSFGNKCCVCKKKFPVAVYDFHHINPEEKKFAISRLWYSPDELLTEIQKCVLVCSNCHRLIEIGEATIPKNAIKIKEKHIKHCRKIIYEVFNNG